MPVIADLDPFAAHGHHSFDVKLVLRHGGQAALRIPDAFGFKDDDFAALRRAPVVGQPIDKQMVARKQFHFQDVIALMVKMPGLNARVIQQESGRRTDAAAPGRKLFGRRPD